MRILSVVALPQIERDEYFIKADTIYQPEKYRLAKYSLFYDYDREVYYAINENTSKIKLYKHPLAIAKKIDDGIYLVIEPNGEVNIYSMHDWTKVEFSYCLNNFINTHLDTSLITYE